MDGSNDFVFYEWPSAVWAIEFINLSGERVVHVLGTECAARQAAKQHGVGAAVLLCSPTAVRPIDTPKGTEGHAPSGRTSNRSAAPAEC
jgi:hypothetical protein